MRLKQRTDADSIPFDYIFQDRHEDAQRVCYGREDLFPIWGISYESQPPIYCG